MKTIASALFIALFSLPAVAQVKSCDELKAEIDAKIQANGVTNYQLQVVPIDQQTDWKVVGTCNGGTMKIIYKRG